MQVKWTAQQIKENVTKALFRGDKIKNICSHLVVFITKSIQDLTQARGGHFFVLHCYTAHVS